MLGGDDSWLRLVLTWIDTLLPALLPALMDDVELLTTAGGMFGTCKGVGAGGSAAAGGGRHANTSAASALIHAATIHSQRAGDGWRCITSETVLVPTVPSGSRTSGAPVTRGALVSGSAVSLVSSHTAAPRV